MIDFRVHPMLTWTSILLKSETEPTPVYPSCTGCTCWLCSKTCILSFDRHGLLEVGCEETENYVNMERSGKLIITKWFKKCWH